MINFHVMTLFPEQVSNWLHVSMTGRALAAGLIGLNCIDIRDFSDNARRAVDDYPYGGGAGIVMSPVPVYAAWESVAAKLNAPAPFIYLSPKGRTFNQKIARELSEHSDIIMLCGHYEGVDQRVIDEIVTDEISIGDYVLTGGEIAAVAVIDAVSRLVPGVLHRPESHEDESFSENLLEYPQYTRPPVFRGRAVPEVLLSGHHKNIENWRREQAIAITRERRPDLLEQKGGADVE